MSNIAIYPKGTSDFFSQGLGILSDVISSNLTQTATSSGNVQQQLVVEYPLGGHLVEQLIEGNFIRASTSAVEADYGIYEIDETLKSDDGLITVYASPYANRILRMTFDNGGRFSSFPSVQLALDEARRNITGFPSNFTLTSGISKSVDLSKDNYPTFGDFLEALNHAVSGNIKYRLFGIQIYSSLGVDIQTPLRDDMNTSSVKIKTDYSNIINKVIPLLPVHDESGNATQDKRVGTIVTSKYANSFLDYWAGKVIDFETQEEANTYFDRTSADRPVHTVEVEPINTEMAAVELFDIVQLYSSRFDYTDKLRVSERVFDTLTETVTKFSLGSSSVNIVNSIIDQSSETLATAIRETISLISANGKGIDSWGAVPPANPHEGDTWFFDDGANSGVKTFVNGDWILLVDLATPENIRTAVVKSLEDARTTSEQIAADLDTKIQGQLTTVNGAMQTINGNLTTLDGKAQAYANKALSDAKADTVTQVAKAVSTAHTELENAKITLNKSITDEASARSNAVSALDTKAQGYANTARADAIATANGAVAKEVTDRQKAITDLDSKSTGAINQAKTDAQSALNALQVGGRNLVIKDKLVNGWMGNGVVASGSSAHARTTDFVAVVPNSNLVAQIWYDNTINTADNYLRVAFYDADKTYITRTPLAATGSTTYNKWLITTPANTAFVRISFDWLGDGYGHAKLEIGNKATDYTQAPEDIVLDYTTKDNIIVQSFTQYQSTNDGKVSRAQSDATQALGLVATKVSQTTFDTKTGDLDSKYTAVKQTADQASTDIVSIKSDNTKQDTKINTLISDASGTKQSISDIQTEQGKQSTKINTIQTDVSGTKQDISDIREYNGTQDGKIVSISTTVDGLSSSFSTYKTTNDGKVSKAQSDIAANATAISQKVSQTAYDAKTGQLQTDLNTTTITANQAKTDIVAIKSDNTKQDARMTTIESDANGTKTTVSNLQTDLGKANGSITTLQQRADGFDATVTKVNAQLNDLSQVNMIVNSEFSPDLAGWYIRGTQTLLSDGPNSSDVGFNKSGHVVLDTTNGTGTGNVNYTSMAYPVTPSSIISVSVELKASVSGTNPQIGFIYYDANMNAVAGQRGGVPVTTDYKLWKYTGTAIPATAKYVSFDILISNVYKAKYVMSQPMMVIGSTVGAYVQGQYNNNGATAKAQLTADNATLAISNYKTDADGRISKAQADITVTANEVKTKVSQTDYNTKTADLTTKVNTAQSTADGAVTTIGAYKTANDGRVASAESKINQNTTAIESRVLKTDYNERTGRLEGQISEVSQTAGRISQSVSDVQNQVNGLSVGGRNLFVLATSSKGLLDIGYNVYSPSDASLTSDFIPVTANTTYVAQQWYIMSHPSGGGYLRYAFYDSTKKPISRVPAPASNSATYSKWVITTPANASFIRMSFDYADNNGSKVKFEQGNMPTDWTPATEDTDNKISTVSQSVDDITSIISNPTTGLSKRVQTAEGTLSQVSSFDIPALQKATYWQPYSSLDLNTYRTQGSYYFNSTTVKPNGPTTSVDWMYLQVEVANADKVTQIAWYDKTTSAKITYKRQYVAGTWSPWYANDNDSVTTISQTNEAIRTEISNRQNGDTNTLTQAQNFTTSKITSYDQGIQSQFTQTSDAILGKVGAINLFPNSEFEQDYGYRSKNPGVTLSLSNKDLVDSKYNGTVTVKATNAGWQGYWARNIGVQGGQKYSGSVLVHYTNGGVAGGNAVLDIWFIDKDGNRINQGTGGSRSTGTGQVSSPYWVNLYFEGVIAPNNAVNLQVSLLTNEKGAGQTAIFTQPIVTATEKLQPYTPNNDITTQLTLLKDNWSIGIASNTGAIASGIAADANAMNIVSPKVIISSPQTQITGTAWIKTAMIADGQISTAKIGDASITSAKILNMDVDKLTGNVSNFIQSNWNGVYKSTSMNENGMTISTSDTRTEFGANGSNYFSSSGVRATYAFGKWSDSNGSATSSTGLYLGATGSENSFINILGTNGSAAAVLAGSAMDFGSNLNVVQGSFNFFTQVNIRERLLFKANRYVGGQPSYIEINEGNRTFNFFTEQGSVSGGGYFYFNQKVISAGTFSSTSVLSKKNVIGAYEEDALGEIVKTQLVNFTYKNRPDEIQVSPIIDDVNTDKEYYIPNTILGQDGEYVDMYSMASMSWKAIQQLNEKIKELNEEIRQLKGESAT